MEKEEQTPKTLFELKNLRKPVRNANKEHKASLNRLEVFALWVTEKVGSIGFFLIIFAWTVLWLSWNTLAPKESRFDPFPAFVLWLFISNTIQIFLMPLIMIGQNLQSRHSEKRADADYEVNLKAEREIEAILQHLENHSKKLEKIMERLEKKE